ncbi:MAG: ATP-binding protein [Bacteroidales bacterium]|nr:ATP-binding protein [Bacteroidales bacterium]
MNPFIIKGYVSKELFCDREKETERLISNALNQSDSVLISPRRYGKSGLIYHVLGQIKELYPDYDTLYVDIYGTQSLKELINTVSSAILSRFPEKTSFGRKVLDFLKGIRPFFSVDPLTGKPEVHFEFFSEVEKEFALKKIFELFDINPRPVVFAIDEFQQIAEYPEKNVEALLRTCTQNLHNVHFIYCGSNRRLMQEMFNDATRPFFSSTSTVPLYKLDRDKYAVFIRSLFESGGRRIEDASIDLILDWTRIHTYYTQKVCHDIFETGVKKVNTDLVQRVCDEILDAESYNYLQLRGILTTQQWRFLIGVAKEQRVSQITSNAFVSKYKIGSAATSARVADSLEQKELLLKTVTKADSFYEVYDVFFSRWLEREY